MNRKFTAYAAAAALTIGTVLGGMPVLAAEPDPGAQNGGKAAVESFEQTQEEAVPGQEQEKTKTDQAAEQELTAKETVDEIFLNETEEEEEAESTAVGEIGWYPLAAFGWSSLAQAQADPSFNMSNYNADPEAYYGIPTVPGYSKVDISGAGGGKEESSPNTPNPDEKIQEPVPVRPEEGLKEEGRRPCPPKPPCCEDDDDDDDDDDDEDTTSSVVANTGNGTTFVVADVSLLPAEFANGAFYSVTVAGAVYFNDIDLSGQYFQTWDDGGNAIAVLALVDENLELVNIDEAGLVNIGSKTYLSFEAEGAVYAAVASDSQLIYRTVCGFDGVVINGSVVMEF